MLTRRREEPGRACASAMDLPIVELVKGWRSNAIRQDEIRGSAVRGKGRSSAARA
jgi:hypothetical protein